MAALASALLFAGARTTFGKADLLQPAALLPERVDQTPVIDGDLGDPTWRKQPVEQPFVSYNPRFGETLPQQTQIWLAYDSEALYFAFRCMDSEADKIKSSITKRDNMFSDDWIGISLDATGNKQSSYDLFVNPDGIQGDILDSVVGGEDLSPDFVWESAGQKTDQGYQVEMRVPLRSIRFKSGSDVRMGILFWRRISRLGMSGAWPELKPGNGLFNAHASVCYRDLKNPLNLEVLPSVTAGYRGSRLDARGFRRTDGSADFGAGVKYGITSSITAEATFNPDFSQVESDAYHAQVNLRYPVFYSEKRPFFMEGMEIFNFSLIPNGMMWTAVHTRRIVDPRWGVKLTGTVGRTAFGVLAAGDEFPGYAWQDGINPNQDKQAGFGVARFKTSLGGENFIGGLYAGQAFADSYNHATGLDAQIKFGKGHQTLFSILGTRFLENRGAPVRNAAAANAMYYYGSRHLYAAAAFQHMGKGFDMPTAFIQRASVNHGWIFMAPALYTNIKAIPGLKLVRPFVSLAAARDLETGTTDRTWDSSIQLRWTHQGFIGAEFVKSREWWKGIAFDYAATTGFCGGQATRWLWINAWASTGTGIFYGGDPPYLGRKKSRGVNITLQPSDRLSVGFSPFSETFRRSSDNGRVYSGTILNSRITYQFNKYFFVRGVMQYDGFSDKLLTDFLASFTLIPGTVMHLGYGSLYEHKTWRDNGWIDSTGRWMEMHRSLFFKASYLWRY
jgi:hypothetical protein